MAASLSGQLTGLNEVLLEYGLKEQDLDKKCPETVRYEVAIKITRWKMIGYYFGFSSAILNAIEVENKTEEERSLALLTAWQEREGRKATYYKLISALYNRRRDLVDFICGLIKQQLSQQQARVSLHPVDGQLQSSAPSYSAVLATRSETQSQTSGPSHPAVLAMQSERQSQTSGPSHPAVLTTPSERQSQTSGPSHPAVLTTLNERQSQTSGPSHPAVLTTLNERQSQTSGPSHPAVLTTLNERQSQISGPSHPAVLATLSERQLQTPG